MSRSVSGKAFDIGLFSRIFSYVKPYKKLFYGTLGIIVVLGALATTRPLLVQYTFDRYVMTGNLTDVIIMISVMFAMLIAEGLLQFTETWFTAMLGQNVIRDLRSQLLNHLLRFRLTYFDNTPVGTLVTRLVSDIQTIADVFSEGFLEIVSDMLKVIVIIIIMFSIDVKLSLITLSTIPVLLFATYIFKNAVKNAFQDVRNQVARLNAFVQEHITGMSIVQIFNREEKEFEKFREINKKHRDANVRSIWYYSVFFPVVEVLSAISTGLLIWWGGKEIVGEQVSVGLILAFLMYLNMLFRPIRQLADRFNTLQMGMVGSERVFRILDTNESIIDSGTLDASEIRGKVEFRNVSFSYKENDWVLRNISFKASPGEKIALVGRTGAGKSSVINLVNRFYEHQQGDILIDDIDIREYTLESLRKNIVYVLQDVFLFSDTIANNISLNDPSISREQVIAAAKALGADEFISRLPGGYDFNVKERGGMLSVGQRQLISFVRAYVFNPKVLILDEATSSVDSQSEAVIQQAIEKLTKGRTSVVIAHRLATIRNADTILVFDHGEIVERGSHDVLLKEKGYYKELYEMQFKWLQPAV